MSAISVFRKKMISKILMCVCLSFLCVIQAPEAARSSPLEPDAAYPVKITINEPVEKIEAGLHMYVKGDLSSETGIPSDATLRIELLDADGNIVRHVSCSEKNSRNMWLYYPGLQYYDEETDPGRKELEAFGWPEIMVRDVDDPEASFLDATIKCWYSDTDFKGMFIYATDPEHGLAFDDTIGFRDENGGAYDALAIGPYTVRITLTAADGAVLGRAEKAFEINYYPEKIAVRFSPAKHRIHVMAWAASHGYKDLGAAVPGYIESMNGHGYLFDMGIIPLNRASNLAFYTTGKIHWFDYNITTTCSTYVIEHAVIQNMGDIENPDRFVVHHYDIGELSISNDLGVEESGRIVSFEEGDHLDLCRIDLVSDEAEENVYYADARNVVAVKPLTGEAANDPIVIDGPRFAVMGVIRPFQLDAEDIHFDPSDNSFSFSNRPETVLYQITDGQGNTKTVEKKAELFRCALKIPATSIFEFYSIFDAEDFDPDTTYTVSVSFTDTHGTVHESNESFQFRLV